MEIDFDKGVDSLLRRDAVARGRGRAQSETVVPDENHLDADELNAYAENALPAVTRAAYTAHLADCDHCRKTVTAMMLIAPIVTQIAEVSSEAPVRAAITEDSSSPVTTMPEVKESSGWLERLRAIFTPSVLVYAVPAVVLLFVGVAAFVALRTDRDGEQQLTAARQEEPTIEQMVTTNGNSNTATTTNSSEANSIAPNINTSSANMANSNMMNSNMGAIESNAANVSPSASNTPAADQRAENASPYFAPPPPPTSTAPQTFGTPLESRANNLPRGQTTDDGITARTGNAQPEARTGNMNAGPMPQQQSLQINERAARDESARLSAEAPPSPTGRSTAARRTRTPPQSIAGGRARTDEEDEGRADMSAPTRTVAGRTFRRQGGAWIDTAYRAGQATVNVARGSEQFRALAADEPIISTIAAQFGGEVIVVLRGRAYRIR